MNDQTLKNILTEYSEKRRTSENTARENFARAMLLPEYADAEEKILSLRETMGRAALSGHADAADIAAHRASINELRTLQRRILRDNGMDENCTEPVRECPLCGDTGYVGTDKCVCLQKRLIREYYAYYKIPCDESASFDKFNADVFPEVMCDNGLTQRQNIINARDYCLDYCRDFPRSERGSILFSGPSGQGKTFLLECIEKEILSRGYVVFRTTAYNLGEIMLRHYLGDGEDGGQEILFTCDLLLIDDLGTEPMRRNVTAEALFNLINERQFHDKGFVISTNLNAAGIRERYGERLLSRLVDRENVAAFVLQGRDIRLGRR